MSDILCCVGTWVICALAAERVTEIITSQDIFAWLRTGLAKIVIPVGPNGEPITRGLCARILLFPVYVLYKIATCGMCNSVWSSMFFSLFLPGSHLYCIAYPSYGEPDLWLTYIPKVFGLCAMANFWHDVYRLVRRGRVRTYDIKLDSNVQGNLDLTNKQIWY